MKKNSVRNSSASASTENYARLLEVLADWRFSREFQLGTVTQFCATASEIDYAAPAGRPPHVVAALYAANGPQLDGHQRKLLKLLLKAGIPVNTTDPEYNPPLTWAVRQKDPQTVSLLLAAGADPNAVSNRQSTPLLDGICGKDVALVKMLLKAGADPNISIADQTAPALFQGYSLLAFVHAEYYLTGSALQAQGATQELNTHRRVMFRLAKLLHKYGARLSHGGDGKTLGELNAALTAHPEHKYCQKTWGNLLTHLAAQANPGPTRASAGDT